MANPCEIMEALVIATSDVAFAYGPTLTDTITVTAAFTGAEVSASYAQEAIASTVISEEHYLLLVESVAAFSDVSFAVMAADVILSASATASNATTAVLTASLPVQSITATATFYDKPPESVLTNTVTASSYIFTGNTATGTLASLATASSSAVTGGEITVLSTATASSSALFTFSTSITVTETVTAIATFFESTWIDPQEVSVATATSSVFSQVTTSATALAQAWANSSTYYLDPAFAAIVMNTETTAGSRYTNYPFESIAQIKGRMFGAGLDGIYELTGDDDNGSPIECEMDTGFYILGTDQQKRIPYMYCGYTADGSVEVEVETYGRTKGTYTFTLESRSANAPAANRAKIAKGLSSLYWRFKFRNVNGSNYSFNRVAFDVAASTRRV